MLNLQPGTIGGCRTFKRVFNGKKFGRLPMEEILGSQFRLSLASTAMKWAVLPFMLSHQDVFLGAGLKASTMSWKFKKNCKPNKLLFLINLSQICYSNGKLTNTQMCRGITQSTDRLDETKRWNKCEFSVSFLDVRCLSSLVFRHQEFRSSHVAFENTQHWPSSSQTKTPVGILVFQLAEGKAGNFSTLIIM